MKSQTIFKMVLNCLIAVLVSDKRQSRDMQNVEWTWDASTSGDLWRSRSPVATLGGSRQWFYLYYQCYASGKCLFVQAKNSICNNSYLAKMGILHCTCDRHKSLILSCILSLFSWRRPMWPKHPDLDKLCYAACSISDSICDNHVAMSLYNIINNKYQWSLNITLPDKVNKIDPWSGGPMYICSN